MTQSHAFPGARCIEWLSYSRLLYRRQSLGSKLVVFKPLAERPLLSPDRTLYKTSPQQKLYCLAEAGTETETSYLIKPPSLPSPSPLPQRFHRNSRPSKWQIDNLVIGGFKKATSVPAKALLTDGVTSNQVTFLLLEHAHGLHAFSTSMRSKLTLWRKFPLYVHLQTPTKQRPLSQSLLTSNPLDDLNAPSPVVQHNSTLHTDPRALPQYTLNVL